MLDQDSLNEYELDPSQAKGELSMNGTGPYSGIGVSTPLVSLL